MESLDIRKVTRRVGIFRGGAWVEGTMVGHRFNAPVFPDHAEHRKYLSRVVVFDALAKK